MFVFKKADVIAEPTFKLDKFGLTLLLQLSHNVLLFHLVQSFSHSFPLFCVLDDPGLSCLILGPIFQNLLLQPSNLLVKFILAKLIVP